MRGTSILSLPGQLLGAALGTTAAVKQRPGKSLRWRLGYQYFLWRMDWLAEEAKRDYHAGKCHVMKEEDFESFEKFKELMR